MIDDEHTIQSGYLDVGDGHKIYYQEWGNPDAPLSVNLHGGPGSQSKQKHKLAFDAEKHHILFFDQRGCGLSTFDEVLRNNTTDSLLSDIDALRHLIGAEKIQLFGYSWGSTLALSYAIKYPERVLKIFIGGVFLGTLDETAYLYENGSIAQFSPEAWTRYLDIIPEEERTHKLRYYFEQLTSSDDNVKLEHLKRWHQLEASIMSFDTDYNHVQNESDESADIEQMSGVLVAAHYFLHDCFLPDNHILLNAEKIQHIPTLIVQGRFDGVCPPLSAHKLSHALGANCHLHIVPSSHAREGAMREVIKAYLWSWF